MNTSTAIGMADRICGVSRQIDRHLANEDRRERYQEALDQAAEEINAAIKEHGQFGYGSLKISHTDVTDALSCALDEMDICVGKTKLGFRADFKAACDRVFEATLLAIADKNAPALLRERDGV